MSDEYKAKGNAAFQQGSFEEAISHFTEGIAVDPGNHVLYSNRSACYASLNKYDKALEDAEKTVELKPDWAKGYSRLGAAYHGLKNFKQALEAYDRGLKIDPNNATLQSGKQSAQQAQAEENKGGPGLNKMFSNPDFLARLAMNPETKGFMNDPSFLKMLQDVQSNPQMLQFYMNDPRLQKALGVGLGINLSMPGEAGGAPPQTDESPEPENQPENTSPQPEPKSSQPQSKPSPQPEKQEKANGQKEAEKSDEDQQKEAAQKEKDLGNAAYKNKEFETAIGHYNKAMELYDKDVSYLTNRAAVYFEMGEYDKCIEDCEAAIEKGRELRADYKLIAKAMTRKGNALVKQEKLEEAITIYKKSLTEHRNPDTLKRLQETEKNHKLKVEQAYVNFDLAAEEKEKGNQLFKDMKYPEAVQHYTDALKRGPADQWDEAYKVFSNRAACYTKLGALNEGLKDAEECIRLKPDFPKGYSRKGHIQFFSKEYEKALQTYEDGLKFDPSNQELLDGKRRCQEKLSEFLQGNVSEEELRERQQKAMQDPEVQNILQDPIMQQVLKDFQENPQQAQKHLKEPQIMTKLSKLMAAGIIQMK